MTLLTILDDVSARIAQVQPAAVEASSDRQVQQLLALANQEGLALARRYSWQAMQEEQTFLTVAAPAQPAALPDDFDRFVPNSFFNRTTRRPITGPITTREWQWIQAQPVYSTVYLAFRQRTGQFLMTPNPAVNNLIAYEYLSRNWAKSNTGTPQPKFLADTDTSFLDEELITLGTTWRFLRAKGLDYAEEMETYEREVEQAMARDGGSTMLTLAPQPIDLNRTNLPDGNFGA